MNRFQRKLEQLRFHYGPRIAQWMIKASTWRARKKLSKTEPIGILLDSNIFGHATTHKTTWISTGQKQWCGQTIDTGYAARVPLYTIDSNDKNYIETRYLPGIISLFQEGYLKFHDSAELQAERFPHPAGRYRGSGWFDLNLFTGVDIGSIDGISLPHPGSSWMNLANSTKQQEDRLHSYAQEDPEYATLLEVLGAKNSQDAWHIRTAELHGLFCFLTMDRKLIRTLKSQAGSKRLKDLKTRVMTPATFGDYIGLLPIMPHVLSYSNASFPVRSDLSWPGKKSPPTKNANPEDAERET